MKKIEFILFNLAMFLLNLANINFIPSITLKIDKLIKNYNNIGKKRNFIYIPINISDSTALFHGRFVYGIIHLRLQLTKLLLSK